MNKEKENFDSITQSLVVSKKTENKELIKIDDGARLKIFICLTLIIIVSSCDGGIIPQQNASIVILIKKLGITKTKSRIQKINLLVLPI